MASSGQSRGFSGGSTTGGYGFQRSRGNTGLTVEQLLGAAQAQGGAVAEVAEELLHPQRSMLSTMGNGFKNAFTGFVDIISAPSNIVAGVLDPNKTVGEALEQNLTVSDIIFGERDRSSNLTGAEIVGGLFIRGAVDILTDPLTYLTFGTSRGLMGISSLNKLEISSKLADDASKILSKSDKELAVILGHEGSQTGVRQAAKSIVRKGEGGEITMSVRGQELMKNVLKEKRAGMTRTLAKSEKEVRSIIISQAKKGGIKLSPDQITKRTKDALDGVDDAILKNTIDAKLDPGFTTTAFRNMLGSHPALLETLVDKGGVKFLGKTILSGQRIASVKPLIPGMTTLDRITAPSRNRVKALFSTSYTIDGKKPAGLISLESRAKNLAESRQNEAFQDLHKVGKKLNLQEDEMDLILAALQGEKPPIDSKLAELYKAVNGITFDENIIDPRVFHGTRLFQGLGKKNLRELRASGLPISELANHTGNLFVKQDIKVIPWRGAGRTKIAAESMAKVSTFIDKDGKRIPGFIDQQVDGSINLLQKTGKDGKFEKVRTIKQVRRDAVEQEIRERIDDNIFNNLNTVDEIQSEVLGLMDDIKKRFDDKTLIQFSKHIDGIEGINPKTKNLLKETLLDESPDIDIGLLISNRLQSSFKNGVKIKKALKDFTEEDLLKAKKLLSETEGVDPNVIAEFNKIVKGLTPKPSEAAQKVAKAGKSAKTPEGSAIEDAIKKLKRDDKLSDKKELEALLDKDSIAGVMAVLKNNFEVTSPGIVKNLDSLITKKQAIGDILRQIDLERVGGKVELKEASKLPHSALVDDFTGEQLTKAQVTIKEARDLGFDMESNVYKIYAVKSQEAIKASVSNQFMKDVAQQYGRIASEAPEGFVALKNIELKSGEIMDFGSFIKGTKNNEDVLFHPEIAKTIEGFSESVFTDEATNALLKNFDSLQNYWKASVTSIFPAFHGRNAISNTFLNFLDIGVHSLNPVRHIQSLATIKRSHTAATLRTKIATGDVGATDELFDLVNKHVFTDNSGAKWTFGELETVIKNNVVAFNPSLVGQIDVSKNSTQLVDDLVEDLFPKVGIKSKLKPLNPFKQNNPLFKIGRKTGNLVEDQARILNFMTNLEKTGDPIQAAQRTKMFLFDYQNLTNFERTVMKRLIPFYSFTRKNLELQVKTMLSNPGRISAEIRAIDTIGDVISGGDSMTKEEKEKLPEWIRDSLNILKSKNGNIVEVFGSIGSPIEAAFGSIKPNQALASVSPLIKFPVELASGHNFFLGKPVSEVTNAAAFKSFPPVVKDFIGFTTATGQRSDGSKYEYYVALRPERMHFLLNLPPTSRVFSSLKQMQTVDVSKGSKILQLLIGSKAHTFDLGVEGERREKELQSQMEKILDDADVGYSFSRFVLKDDKKKF